MKSTQRFLFQVHVWESIAVADHCSTYALSNVTDSQLQTPYQYEYGQNCSQCEDLRSVVQNELCMPDEELEVLLYTYKQLEEAITSWKTQQLRSVRQDQVRIDCINLLDETSVMIFLPRKVS